MPGAVANRARNTSHVWVEDALLRPICAHCGFAAGERTAELAALARGGYCGSPASHSARPRSRDGGWDVFCALCGVVACGRDYAAAGIAAARHEADPAADGDGILRDIERWTLPEAVAWLGAFPSVLGEEPPHPEIEGALGCLRAGDFLGASSCLSDLENQTERLGVREDVLGPDGRWTRPWLALLAETRERIYRLADPPAARRPRRRRGRGSREESRERRDGAGATP